jgi:gamma-glutamyl-gamma-aminobutyrate hydrolase PuuD
MPSDKVIIGLSPRILRNVPRELGFRNKTLQYLEQSMAHCVMREGAIVVMIPTVERTGEISASEVATEDYVVNLDGLILQGGADIDPSLYGEAPVAELGPTDAVRDRFELELLRAFAAADKPVLGICRGLQLINVAFGGTLHQDLGLAGISQPHRDLDLYDELAHDIRIVRNSQLAAIYGGIETARVTSIHHQALKKLGTGIIVEATSTDAVIEAARHAGHAFVMGVQWHPEFHDARFPSHLPTEPLVKAFIDAAARRK